MATATTVSLLLSLLLPLLLVQPSLAWKDEHVHTPVAVHTPVTVCAVSAEVVYTDTSLLAKDISVTHVDVVNPLTSLTTLYQTSIVPIRRYVYETVTASPQYIQVTDIEIVPTTVLLPATRVNTVFSTLSVTEVEIFTVYESNIRTVYETVTDLKTKYVEALVYQTTVEYVTTVVPRFQYTTVVEAVAVIYIPHYHPSVAHHRPLHHYPLLHSLLHLHIHCQARGDRGSIFPQHGT